MGNTNIPQFGAAGTENSRDTLSGTDQLTDEQRKQSPRAAGSTEPPPDVVPSAPGQTRDTAHKKEVGQTGEDDDEQPDKAPDMVPTTNDKCVYEGHQNTGHSPSDAT